MGLEYKKFIENKIENIKEKVDNYILETKIENKFKEEHSLFILYEFNNLLPKQLSGYFIKDNIIVYGNLPIKEKSILIDKNNNIAYNVKGSYETEIKINYQGKEYIKIGTVIIVDKKVKEVKVIKAGKRYFLYDD